MKSHFVLMFACLPFAAHAKVTTATLFPSLAQVTWEQGVTIEKGRGELKLKGLPVGLQDETLQAELQGLPGILIQRVQVQRVEQADVVEASTRNLRERLSEVESRVSAKNDNIQAWNQQVTLMSEAARAPGEVTASELALLATTVQEQTQGALEKIRGLKGEMVDDLAERDRIKRELAATQQNARATKQVSVVYQSEWEGEATASLQYQTNGAGWRSQYSARLSTADDGNSGIIDLEHTAVIRQSTGIDWDGVDLTLSTVNTRMGTDLPPLNSWVVTPGVPEAYRSKAVQSMVMDSMDAEKVSEMQGAAIQNDGAFTQSYKVPATVTLTSSNSDQFISVASYDIPAEVETRFFPAMNTNGFIYGTGKFDTDITLPAGPLTIYRDGQSVGRSQLDSLSMGTEVSLGFGTNDRVVAKVVAEENQQGEKGVFKGEKYVRRVNRYEVTNNHPNPVSIRVYDRIPVSQQGDMTVEALDITQPVNREVDDLKGVLSWSRVVLADQTISFKSGFELRVPEDSELPPVFR